MTLFSFCLTLLLLNGRSLAQTIACAPGWIGDVLIDCESTQHWSVEHDGPSSGRLAVDTGIDGHAVRLDWDLADGNWVQAKYTFPQPIDLSRHDIIGLSLHGSAGTGNRVSIMLADKQGVFYGLDNENINTIERWMINLPFPKTMFYHFFTFGPNPNLTEIDWSQIDRLFVVIKRPGAASGGGNGSLLFDLIQADRAADWPRQEHFEAVATDSGAAAQAVSYILNQQQATGLLVSWQEEPTPRAYLYDQALALIVLSREGEWTDDGTPHNDTAAGAERLAAFLAEQQKPDGHWARAWNPKSGVELVDDQWIGDQAWCIIALQQYVAASGDAAALAAAHRAADWLADMVQPDGFVHASTEGTVDAWWAMIATQRFNEADRIQNRLLATHWDADMQYWMRGYGTRPDPVIAMDAATWLGEFAKTARVNRPDMALAALSFVRRTLITLDDSNALCGFDGMGPVSLWCEGTAQYISAGGQDAQKFLNTLLSLQREDGGMPGSPDNWSGTGFGWLSSWSGLSSTAWLYFALTQSPFADLDPTAVISHDKNPKNHLLLQNYPNPFNPHTTIQFELKQDTDVEINIYNTLWQKVRTLTNDRYAAGYHTVHWDGTDKHGNEVGSGLYLYRLQTDGFSQIRKMTLLR